MVKESSCRAPCLTFCPLPEPRLLQQHTSLPQHLAVLRAACCTPVQSAWSRCPHGSHTAGSGPGSKCAPGPWTRNTGPALEAVYCSSQIALALPQQLPHLAWWWARLLRWWGSDKPMLYHKERVMAAARAGSCLGQEGMHGCFASIAPEFFLVISWEIKVWDYPLGLPFKEIIFLHPSMLDKLQESWLSEAGICSCSVCIKKVDDFLKHSGLLLNSIPGKQSSFHWRTEQWCFWLQTVWFRMVLHGNVHSGMRKMHEWEEVLWAGQDAVPVQSLLHWDISCQGWLCALMGQLRLPGWPLPPGVCMRFRWVWKLEKQVSSFPGGCASVEVVMGLVWGRCCNPFLANLSQLARVKIYPVSWLLSLREHYQTSLNTEAFEDSGYF